MYTHMLLSVRQNLPQSGKKLDPRLLRQCCGNVTQLDESAEQGPSLQKENRLGSRPRAGANHPATQLPHTSTLSRLTDADCARQTPLHFHTSGNLSVMLE